MEEVKTSTELYAKIQSVIDELDTTFFSGKGNVVKLLGHFCKVTAYTDKTVKTEYAFEWKHGDGFYSATFLTCDGAWIEVRVKTAYFDYWYSHFVEGLEVVQVEGRLCTEISRGNGIARNYIAIG